MADLSKSFKEVMQEIEKAQIEIAKRESELNALQVEIKIKEQEIADKLHNIAVDEKAIEKKKAEILYGEGLKEKESWIYTELDKLSAKKIEGMKYENKLAEIRDDLNLRLSKVEERERNVSVREKEYKEVVKKEFFEDLQKRLPR